MSDRERQIQNDLTYMWNLRMPNSQEQRVVWWFPKAGKRGHEELLVTGCKLSDIR